MATRKLFVEGLESRRCLAFSITFFSMALGKVSFVGTAGADSLQLSESGGLLVHNATLGDFASQSDIDPGPGVAALNIASADVIEVFAGDGDDSIDASGVRSGPIAIFGEGGNDVLVGGDSVSPLGDTIDGGDGDDTIRGLGGDDLLVGGAGNDRIFGDAGNDILKGNSGDDTLDLGTGLDEVDGGDGDDSMTFAGEAGEFVIEASDANVVVFAAGDGSSTGLFGAVGLESIVVNAIGSTSSMFTVSDLTGTTVKRLGVELVGGLKSGSVLRVKGTESSDVFVVRDDFVFATPGSVSPAEASVQTPWGKVAFNGRANTHLIVDAGGGDDSITIESSKLFAGTDIAAEGGIGNDTVTVGVGRLNHLAAPMKIVAGAGLSDRLLVVDDRNNLSVDYRITATEITSSNSESAPANQVQRRFGGITYDSGLEFARVEGSNAKNQFDVFPSSSTEFTIDGNLPRAGQVASRAGDFLKLFTEGTTGRSISFTSAGSGNGKWAFEGAHKDVKFESIERFNHVERLALGANAGRFSDAVVQVLDAETRQNLFEIQAYEVGYRGGVRVATGDIDQDGIPDIITAPGRVHAPTVRVFDGVDGKLIREFRAYDGDFSFGVFVDAGDVDGDLVDDIVTVPGRGTAVVHVFRNEGFGRRFTLTKSFDAFSSNFIGGATVAIADISGDGYEDILVGSGSGMEATVKVFDSATNANSVIGNWIVSDAVGFGGVNFAAGIVSRPETATLATSETKRGVRLTSASLPTSAFKTPAAKAVTATLNRPELFVGSGPRGGSHATFYRTPTALSSTPTRRTADSRLPVFDSLELNPRAAIHLVGKDFDQDGSVDAVFAGQGSDGKAGYIQMLDTFFGSFANLAPQKDKRFENGFFLG